MKGDGTHPWSDTYMLFVHIVAPYPSMDEQRNRVRSCTGLLESLEGTSMGEIPWLLGTGSGGISGRTVGRNVS